MATSKCLRCGLLTDTLAPSGLCTDCSLSDTEQRTRAVESEAATLSRDPHDTATQDGPDEWAGVLPEGGYQYDPKPIGVGGMGVVWRAVRVSTGQVVAIKKLKAETFTPAHVRRFVAEARALALLRHDNIVFQHDFVPDPADPFLVLEYVPGESLADYIKSVRALHPKLAARLIRDAALGIAHAHSHGIIHRDLKPGNLLLTRTRQVKVADFGLGKVLAEAEVETLVGATASGGDDTPQGLGALTATGRLAGGTPGFMAPEQVSVAFGEIGPATDVFGLGGCLYACLTGDAPFPAGRQNKDAVLTASLVPLRQKDPRVPADLSAIVEKCLRKEQSERYKTAADLAADLDRYLAGDETTARRHPWPRRQWQKVKKTPRAVVIAVAVAVLAVAVGITLAMVPWRKEPMVATSPKTDPPTPELIQDEYRRNLRAGKTVTLIGETGLPKTYGVPLGAAQLRESWTGDHTTAFESVAWSLVELLDDPGVDSYSIVAEVRQLQSQLMLSGEPPRSGEGSVGIYVGYQPIPTPDGGTAQTLLRLAFCDYDWAFLRAGKVSPQPVSSEAVVFLSPPNGLPTPTPMKHAEAKFTPAISRPGEWRTVEYEIGPNSVRAYWGEGETRQALAGVRYSADELYGKLHIPINAKYPQSGVPVPVWSARRPVGLYCHSSAVAVRNVTITPR